MDGLASVFTLGTVEDLKYFLGFEVERKRDRRLVRVHQRRFVLDMLHRFGLDNCNPVRTPLVPSGSITFSDTPALTSSQASLYRSMVGSLLWVAMGTRPDIAFATTVLTRYLKSPTESAMTAAKRVMRYLKGAPSLALVYNGSPARLTGQTDSSWANCADTRRSYSGYLFSLSNGAAISWSSRLQRTVALSSTEAEYISCTDAGKEAVWLRSLATALGVPVAEPTLVHQDNEGAKALTQNSVFHNRTKHIDVRYHKIRELVDAGQVKFSHTPGTDLAADVLTKPVSGPSFATHCNVLFGNQNG